MYMGTNPANVLPPSSQRSVCTICVFIGKTNVQKSVCVGGCQTPIASFPIRYLSNIIGIIMHIIIINTKR